MEANLCCRETAASNCEECEAYRRERQCLCGGAKAWGTWSCISCRYAIEDDAAEQRQEQRRLDNRAAMARVTAEDLEAMARITAREHMRVDVERLAERCQSQYVVVRY